MQSYVILLMFSYFEPNFIEKFLCESGFFPLIFESRCEIKIGSLAAIFKRCNI